MLYLCIVGMTQEIIQTLKSINKMTQVEFTNRTQVEVSAKEYAAIEEVYMNSDLDKDAFCKMWVKMNKSRVEAAKEARLEAEIEATRKEVAFDLYNRLTYVVKNYEGLGVEHLSVEEELFVENSLGIELQEWSSLWGCKMFKTTLTLAYELGGYCGAIQA